MANEKNLIPLNKRSKKAQREIQQKGRDAFKKKCEKRKALKETLTILLELGNTQEEICKKLISGEFNPRTFEVIRDTIGEKPVEVHKLEEPVVVKKVFITPEDKQAVERHIEEALRDGN